MFVTPFLNNFFAARISVLFSIIVMAAVYFVFRTSFNEFEKNKSNSDLNFYKKLFGNYTSVGIVLLLGALTLAYFSNNYVMILNSSFFSFASTISFCFSNKLLKKGKKDASVLVAPKQE